MMKKHSSIFSFSLLGIALVCFFIIKLYCSEFIGPNSLGIRGIKSQKKMDILIFGTSHVESGYHLPDIEKEIGKSTFLFWYPGMNIIEYYYYIRYLISHNLMPKTLVIDIASGAYAADPSIWSIRTFYEAPVEVKLELLKHYQTDYPDVSNKKLLKLLFTGYSNEMITFPFSNYFVESSYKKGFRDSTKRAVSPEQFLRLKTNFRFLKTKGKVLPIYERYLQKLLTLLQSEYKGQVLFVETPMIKKSISHPFIMSMKGHLKSMIEAAGYPYMDIADTTSFATEQSKYFSDDHHLSNEGRDANTIEMIKILKATSI